MGNKAETAAMRAYPPKFVSPKRGAKRIQSEKVDTHAPTRAIYRKGYELAEKEIKDTLLEWAKEKQYESFTIVADNFWQEVIDKLNSM